jgi:hypothetical protein
MHKYNEEREFRRLQMERLDRKEQEEREYRQEELRLRVRESQRKDTPASRLKFYGDAIRNSAFKMGNDPIDLVNFFNNMERLFRDLQVPDNLRVSLLRPYLNDKARSLLSCLDPTTASNYAATKRFLLHEFQQSSQTYLQRFNSIQRNSDEKYVLFCARLTGLHGLLSGISKS